MVVIGSVFLAVGLVLGTVLVLLGSRDYSAYTARATATVVAVTVDTSRDSSGKTRTSTGYDVQFTAGGRTVRVPDIGGVHSGDYTTGDAVSVAFPPDRPQDAVWAYTVEGGQDLLKYIGLGIGAVFAVLGAVILALGSRRSDGQPVPVGSGVGGPPAPDPGPAAIGRAWTFDEVVADLVRRTADTPYTVDRSGSSVTVRVNLADTSWWALLQRQGLRRSYATTLTEAGPATVKRSDSEHEVEWAAGPDGMLSPVATGRTTTSGGRVWAVGSERIWAVGPSGVSKVVDYRLDSGELQGLIALTLDRAGWSTALDSQSKIGLWVAGVAGVGAVATVVVLLLR
jgi:hypothetical protein